MLMLSCRPGVPLSLAAKRYLVPDLNRPGHPPPPQEYSTVHMRDDMLVNTFQDWFSKRLAAFNLLARVGGGPLPVALVQLVLYGESTTVELEVTCKCCSLKLLQQ